MKAILSVYNKEGLEEFARGLIGLEAELYSTGGTQRALAQAGIPVSPVSKLTGFPEILDGRVKTLHPSIHGGILARRELPQHMEQLAKSAISPIDLVTVNLYPFRETVAREGVSLEEALENIDIGGPTLLRAAAKNYPSVLAVVDPADYPRVLEGLKKGSTSLEERRRLAAKAFQHVASYDTAISQYLRGTEDLFPEELTLAMRKLYQLRYGENPHQKAAFYLEEGHGVGKGPSLAAARLLAGKELSYNNILDLEAALNILLDFPEPIATIIKHNNPCGLASRPSLAQAYRLALEGDPVSAFGGIVGVNRPVDREAAQEISRTHFDAIIASSFTPEALELLRRKKDLRLVEIGPLDGGKPPLEVRRVRGGFLLQSPDWGEEDPRSWRPVTRRQATESELADLAFAWKAVKHIKSNAIALVKDRALLGMGAGQPNRVTSVNLAVARAGEKARGSVLGSDAFFPFPDGVEAAGKAGVTAIVQPGGSVRDEEVIKAAEAFNIAMLFTGIRHFKH